MTYDHTEQRLTELANRLVAATTGRAAQWQLEGDDVFVWTAAEGSVTVGSRDRDGEPPYELVVYNPARERVDELTSQLLTDDQPAPWNDSPSYTPSGSPRSRRSSTRRSSRPSWR